MGAFLVNFGLGLAFSGASALLAPAQKVEGQRLSTLDVPKSEYGAGIPWCWGKVKVAGNKIWATQKKEIKKTKKKKVGFGSKVTETTYNYFGNVAYLLSETPFRPLVQVDRIWLNDTLVFTAGGDTLIAEYVHIYHGQQTTPNNAIATQKPATNYDYNLSGDDRERAIQIAILNGNPNPITTPAFTNRSYIAFEDFPLDDFNNELPTLAAEINAGNNCTLGQIVKDLMGAAGFSSNEYDTAGIDNFGVTGFFIERPTSVKESLELLQQAYFFDIVNSNGVFKFLPSYPRPVVNLSPHFFGAYSGSGDSPALYEEEVEPVEAIASEIELTYIDKDLSYAQNTVYSRSQVGDLENKKTVNLPIVMNAEQAKNIANRLLLDAWAQQSKIDFSLPVSQSALEVGDFFSSKRGDNYPIYKITQISCGADRLLKIRGTTVRHNFSPTKSLLVPKAETAIVTSGDNVSFNNILGIANTSTGQIYDPGVDYLVDGGGIITLLTIAENTELTVVGLGNPQEPPQTVVVPGDTELNILDINAIEDSDDLLLYFCAGGDLNWRSASLYASTNDSNYLLIGGLDNQGAYGVAELLPGGEIQVTLIRGYLSTIDSSDLAIGENLALWGREIIQFQTANLIAPSTYLLPPGVLRSKRGTSPVVNNPDRFILLTGEDASVTKLPYKIEDIGQLRYYKAVTAGQAIELATPIPFTIVGNALKPYSPLLITATKDAVGNITFRWVRRDRKAGDRTDYGNFPLSEVWEKYEIDIFDPNSNVLKRTLFVDSPSAYYSRASQLADFSALATQVSVVVYQISGAVGRGHPGTALLTPTFVSAAPAITGFAPSSGYVGDTIRIYGSGLAEVTSATIGSVNCTNLAVVNDGEITAIVGVGTTGGVISLTAPGGVAVSLIAWVLATAPLLNSDQITQGSVNLFLSANERIKLAGIQAGATDDLTATEIRDLLSGLSGTNRLDSDNLKQGSVNLFLSSAERGLLTNFSENVDDRVAALLQAGSNITLTYNDTANTLTIASAGLSDTFSGAYFPNQVTTGIAAGASINLQWGGGGSVGNPGTSVSGTNIICSIVGWYSIIATFYATSSWAIGRIVMTLATVTNITSFNNVGSIGDSEYISATGAGSFQLKLDFYINAANSTARPISLFSTVAQNFTYVLQAYKH